MKQLSFISFILFIGLSQFGFSQTEWKSETFHGKLKGMHFTATIDYKVDCEHATPFVRATLKEMEVYKFEHENETYQYDLGLPIKADEGFLVLDGEITLVKGGDFNGTFDLNEKHLSSKIGGSGNSITADEFRFANESEVTKIMGVNSCSSALEKLKYTTAILEITLVDIEKYDGDLRLNGRAINDILKEKINESVSSKSNSNNNRSYLEEAKEKKNEYMEQLDREERLEQNRRAESERKLNQIQRSNQDPTIKSIEVAEKKLEEVFDSYWNQAAIAQQQERERGIGSLQREMEEESRQAREENKKHEIYLAYRHHLDEREKLIAPIRNEIKGASMDYDEGSRGLHKAFIEAKKNNAEELYVLPIFQYSHLNYNKETYEMYDKVKYYIETFTPIKFDLSIYDTQIGNTWTEINKIIRSELQNQGYYRWRRNDLVFMHSTSSNEPLANLKTVINNYDESILVYKHHSINNQSIADIFHRAYLRGIDEQKLEENQLQLFEKEKEAYENTMENYSFSSLKKFNSDYPNSKFSANVKTELKKFDTKKKSLNAIKYQSDESKSENYFEKIRFYPNLERVSIYLSKYDRHRISNEDLELSLDYLRNFTLVKEIGVSIDSFYSFKKVFDLIHLEELRIDQKNLNPDALIGIEKLVNLKFLKFYQNTLNVSKLPENITLNKSLRELNLSFNKIQVIPESIGNLKELEVLNLNGCGVENLPTSIGELTKLKELNLRGCNLSNLPESIGRLSSLEVLNIRNSKITTIPESIGQLTKLRILNMLYNPIERVPNLISNLQALERLELTLSPNCDCNNVINAIMQLENLKELRLHSNVSGKFDKLPEDISQLQLLEKLVIEGTFNYLPNNILNLPKLNELEITNEVIKKNKDLIKKLVLSGVKVKYFKKGKGVIEYR